MTKFIIYISILYTLLATSCSPSRSFPVNYYNENEEKIHALNYHYQTLYLQKPFAAEFNDKQFGTVTFELKTDSLRYIFEFKMDDPFLKDTLYKYGYDSSALLQLVKDMKEIKCTWINLLDYYIDANRKMLTFISFRHASLDKPFSPKKYFILTIYEQPQYYDADGRLLDRRDLRRLRKVNNETFWRITDKVCYTLSAKFR